MGILVISIHLETCSHFMAFMQVLNSTLSVQFSYLKISRIQHDDHFLVYFPRLQHAHLCVL